MSNTKSWSKLRQVQNTAAIPETGVITNTQLVNLGTAGGSTGPRSRPKPKPLTPTDFDSHRWEYVHGGYGYACTWSFRTRSGTRHYAFSNGPRVSTDLFADGAVALTKARAGMSENSFGEFLGELHQSVDMIVGAVTKMSSFANNVKRGAWGSPGMRPPSKRAKRTPGSLRMANNWLEFQYGWLPFIRDIYDIINAYHSGMTRRGTRVGRKSSHTVSDSYGNKATARAGYSGIVSNEVTYNLNRWGLLNPAQIAWNLTRLSFVFDWFVPVSRTLGAITSSAGLSQISGWATSNLVQPQNYAGRYCSTDVYLYTRYSGWSRRVAGPVIIPVFWRSEGAWQAGRIASAVALLRQQAR